MKKEEPTFSISIFWIFFIVIQHKFKKSLIDNKKYYSNLLLIFIFLTSLFPSCLFPVQIFKL